MNILNFIKNNKKLNDKRIIIKFEEKYETQNGGILNEDIIKWVENYNKNFEYKQIENTLCLNTKIDKYYLVNINNQHLYAVYVHNGIIEDYNSINYQYTTNNCSLYAGIILIIRPLLKNMSEMKNILKNLSDKQYSKSALKLAEISKYYFDRGIEWFNYSSYTFIKIKQEDKKTCYIYFHGLNHGGLITLNKLIKNCNAENFYTYNRYYNTPMKELNNFMKFFNILKNDYTTFVLIGHSYGATYAKYFAYHIQKYVKVLAVSLDGCDLKQTAEYIAYNLLKINKKNKIKYSVNDCYCDDHKLFEEWDKIRLKDIKKYYGNENIIEARYNDIYKTAKICNKLMVNYIIFNYHENLKNPKQIELKPINDYEYNLYYDEKYNHGLHEYKIVWNIILKTIDERLKKL